MCDHKCEVTEIGVGFGVLFVFGFAEGRRGGGGDAWGASDYAACEGWGRGNWGWGGGGARGGRCAGVGFPILLVGEIGGFVGGGGSGGGGGGGFGFSGWGEGEDHPTRCFAAEDEHVGGGGGGAVGEHRRMAVCRAKLWWGLIGWLAMLKSK